MVVSHAKTLMNVLTVLPFVQITQPAQIMMVDTSAIAKKDGRNQPTVTTSVKTSTNVPVLINSSTIASKKPTVPTMMAHSLVLVNLISMTLTVTAPFANKSMNALMALIHVTNSPHAQISISHAKMAYAPLNILHVHATLVSLAMVQQTVPILTNALMVPTTVQRTHHVTISPQDLNAHVLMDTKDQQMETMYAKILMNALVLTSSPIIVTTGLTALTLMDHLSALAKQEQLVTD